MKEVEKTPRRVLVITGPTAAGKTALGVELALRLGGEVISADSMQLYRGMDIGTAKVRPEEMRGVPHHLIDVAEACENWSVSRWTDAAAAAAEDIFSRGHVPVIVGGTGLYIDSLLSGRDFAPAPGDMALRDCLSREYDAVGGEAFREKLRAVDPERAEKLAPADKKRLVRALEIYRLTGQTATEHDRRTRALPPRWPSMRIGVSFASREDLYRRIDRRADTMLREGLLAEVEALLASGTDEKSTAMQAIGYKELASFLRGERTLEQAAEDIRRESRRYAKRQLTWLRRDRELHWLLWEGDSPDTAAGAEYILALWRGQDPG